MVLRISRAKSMSSLVANQVSSLVGATLVEPVRPIDRFIVDETEMFRTNCQNVSGVSSGILSF
jgi:hypothetical protein